jgi:hypothetical protein
MKNLVLLATGLQLFCVSSAFAQSIDRFKIRVYHDTSFPIASEDPDFNPCITNGSSDDDFRQVYFSIDLEDELQPDEILLVLGELLAQQTEGTNTGGFTTGVYFGTTRKLTGTEIDQWEDVNFQICERNGQNLSLDDQLEFDTHTKVGTWMRRDNDFAWEQDRQYVNLWAKINHTFVEVCADDVDDSNRPLSQLTVVRLTPVVAEEGFAPPHDALAASALFEDTNTGQIFIPNTADMNDAKPIYIVDLNPASGTPSSDPLRECDIILAIDAYEACIEALCQQGLLPNCP